MTTDSISIALNFTYPEMIKSDNSTQLLKVKARFSDFEPMWDDEQYLVNIRLPKQIKQTKAAENAIAAIDDAGDFAASTTVIATAINIFLVGSLQQLWGMINGM